jgi:DNA-directed RNA polymerase beta subunit
MTYQTSLATKDFDENGMIRIGAEVKPGDILLKDYPKGESDPTPKRNCFVQSLG